MQVIKMKEEGSTSFDQAHSLANKKAESILGENINIAYYNGDLKLVSPTLTSCFLDEWEDCGAESYAKANGAQLLVNYGDRYKFFYRNVKDDYEEPSPSPFKGYTGKNPFSDLGE